MKSEPRTSVSGWKRLARVARNRFSDRRAENGKLGNWDKLSGRMNPAKTVFKLRSTPAPSLAAALDAKPEVAPHLTDTRPPHH